MQTTQERPATYSVYGADSSAFTYDGHRIEKGSDGNHAVSAMPIFKAGTFRDSMGDQQSWSQDHLRQMVDNFELLRARDIFPNVPVRADHSNSIDNVVGYIDRLSLSSDGQFLLADYTLTEPVAAEKLARKTYRSRSIEIGMFETNTGEMFFPVVFGFAFVDIPAVEGLHSKQADMRFFSLTADISPTNKESALDTNDDRGASKPEATTTTTTSATFGATSNTLTMTQAPVRKFRINGVEVEEGDAVQSHIDALEAFAKETRDGNRRLFVSSLAEGKKIAATQVEALTDLVVEMNDAQFDKFKSAYEAAPVLSILASHGASHPNLDGDQSAENEEINILKETIAQHRRAGLNEDQIAKTASFKKLASLTASSK